VFLTTTTTTTNSIIPQIGHLILTGLTPEDNSYQEPTRQENFLSNPLYHDVPVTPLMHLHRQLPRYPFWTTQDQICSQTFGSVNALNYEIIEEEGKESKWGFLYRILPHPLLFNFRETVHPHNHAA
jgi:hypothetical protein